ncbi:protein of unknown function [Burkholderia multivorans]
MSAAELWRLADSCTKAVVIRLAPNSGLRYILQKSTYKKRIGTSLPRCATFMRHKELPHGLHPTDLSG